MSQWEKRKAHQNLGFSPFPAEICSQKAGARAAAWAGRSHNASWQMSLSARGENGFWKAPELWGTSPPEEHTSFSAGNELYTPSSRVSAPTVGTLVCTWQNRQLKCWFDAWHFNTATLLKHDPHLLLYLKFPKGYSLFDPSCCFPEESRFPFPPLKKTAGLSSPSKTDTF